MCTRSGYFLTGFRSERAKREAKQRTFSVFNANLLPETARNLAKERAEKRSGHQSVSQ